MAESRKQQKERTRNLIIEKAYELFALEGFRVSSKVMASYIGVAEGSLFAHFSTTENLIVKTVEHFNFLLADKLRTLSDDSACLKELLEGHIDVIAAHEGFYAKLVDEQATLPRDARSSFLCIQSALSEHLFELAKSSANTKKIPQHIIFNCWIGLLHYYILNRRMFCSDCEPSVLMKHKEVLVESFMIMITN